MKNWLKILLALAVIGIIAAILVYVFVYNKPHKNIEKAKAEFSVNADSLFHQFQQNNEFYSHKYNGKVIEITGKISKTELTDSSAVTIFVFSQGLFGDEGIRCNMLPKYFPDARKLVTGQEVSIKGLCAGYNGTDVVLDECSFKTNY